MKYLKNVVGAVLLACLIAVSQAEEFCTDTYSCGACEWSLIPVCGVSLYRRERKTYDNCCEAKCDNATVIHEGECKEEGGEKLCLCSLEYKPVCGEDAAVYPNACVAECKGVKAVYEGDCSNTLVPLLPESETCSCTKEYNPHCGSDGKTYANPCLLICANAKPVGRGPCREKPLN